MAKTTTATTTPKMPPADPNGYALLECGSVKMLLRSEDAAQVFALLCRGELLDYDWSARTYKRLTDADRMPTLKAFTLTQYAQLALEDPAG